MKKQLFVLFAVVAIVALSFTGCTFGTIGNPSELTGTWNASVTSVNDNTANALVGTKAGTYTLTTVDYPDGDNGVQTTTSVSGATTTTTKTYNDTITTTTVKTITIGTDGSVTDQTVTSYAQAARDAAPASTASVSYVGAYTAAQTAGTLTVTTTDVYTVVVNADGKTYTQKKVSSTAYTGASGAYSGLGLVDTSSVSFTYEVAKSAIKANTISTAGYTATAATSNESSTENDKTVTTYALVIAEAGTYTKTTTATQTRTADNANGVGTAVQTIVETGTISGANDNGKVVTFAKTGTTYTVVGTGSLISAAYPSTSTTYTDDEASAVTYNYYLTNGTLVLYNVMGVGTSYTKAKS